MPIAHLAGDPVYICANYRPLPDGKVTAELYDESGYHRTAVVADCGRFDPNSATRYCKEKNQ